MKVKFYEFGDVPEENLKFVVIASKKDGKWIFVKQKEKNTWEIPGGHIEEGEDYMTAAKRELFEETGADIYTIKPVCIYSVIRDDETFGVLLYSEVENLSVLPDYEIEKAELFEDIPDNLTYPEIQPKLKLKIEEFLKK